MKLKKGDLIIIAAVILVAAAAQIYFLAPKSVKTAAEITQDGRLLKTVELNANDNYEFVTDASGDFVFEANNGRIRIVKANCPDQICVRTGWVSQAGQAIICIPNRLQVKVRGNDSGVDVILN
jgi:hypothetical protein